MQHIEIMVDQNDPFEHHRDLAMLASVMNQEAGVTVVKQPMFRKSAGMGFLEPETIKVVVSEAAPFIAALAAFYAARSSTKLRVKSGDVEVEGRSVKEVEKLLKLATAIKEKPPE